jgi:hypothetical protein
MNLRQLQKISSRAVLLAVLIAGASCSTESPTREEQPYDLGRSLRSRSISFENPSGQPGEGGKEASKLGVGRKGFPARNIAAGETVVLCDILEPGTIRHIWMTGSFKDHPASLRSMVIRAWWDNQEHPSIECPLGDFMGSANGRISPYQSAVHSTGINAAFNFWLPMPFSQRAKITLTNEGDSEITVFYQIDYTVGDRHPEELGRLHVCFLRENPTTLQKDFEILPKRSGKGRYVGTVLGIRSSDQNWWGEGEIKIYMDGDTEFPTICGTGSEDYVCLSYGMQETPYRYHGCSWNRDGYVSMYRWHLPDPIFWERECRITIQQIGYDYSRIETTGTALYEPVPSEPLPPLPGLDSRIADL